MLEPIITFIVLIVVLGALIWWFTQAPIDAVVKQWGTWLLYGAAIFVIIKFGLPLFGISVF
jgi:hypothetical protein